MLKLVDLQPSLLIGHRGYPSLYPENTLVSFEAAVAAGVQLIEMDLTLTKDRQVVVIHDAQVDRTTNSRGPVSGKTWRELQMLDAGGWFAPKFRGEQIPSLEQVLNRLKGRTCFNLEIKPEAYEPENPTDSLINQLIEQISRRGLFAQVLVSSFSWPALMDLAHRPRRPLLGMLSETAFDSSQLEQLKELKPFSYHPEASQVTAELVALVHSLGCRVFPYTVNELHFRKQLFAWGVDGVFTDAPV